MEAFLDAFEPQRFYLDSSVGQLAMLSASGAWKLCVANGELAPRHLLICCGAQTGGPCMGRGIYLQVQVNKREGGYSRL